ncbi:MAG: cupin domain-containing protein [Verrucomicrobiota bacterium]
MSTPRADSGRRFVTAAETQTDLTSHTLNTWLSRPGIVPCESLLLVRATLDAGRCHGFHRHPTREEIIYVLSGQAEQWCGREHRILKPGEMVLIPKNEIHGTYNPFREPVIFLAMLSPVEAEEPGTVNEWDHEPWASLRRSLGLPECR